MRTRVDEASSIPSQVGIMAAVEERKGNRMNATNDNVKVLMEEHCFRVSNGSRFKT